MKSKIYQRVNILFLSAMLGFALYAQSTHAGDADVLSAATLKEIWFQDDEFSDAADIESALSNETYNIGNDLDSLLHAKSRMISGDLRTAKFYLNRINDKKSKLSAVKKRYLATIAFIEGDFKTSLDYLSDKRLSDITIYPQVCLLKMINYMAVNRIDDLKTEKEMCMYYTGKNYIKYYFWLYKMFKLKLKELYVVIINLLTYT